MWPVDSEALVAEQLRLAAMTPEPWTPPHATTLRTAGCWVCFPRGLVGRGAAGDLAWVSAVSTYNTRVVQEYVTTAAAGAPYAPGLLALRLGPLLEGALRSLTTPPDVVLLDASGRDHPRRAGLALHLGAVLDLPSVGVTHRPLLAEGDWPANERGATSPLRIGTEIVGCWLRTRPGTRPLAVHPGWRADPATAVEVVMGATGRRRTPEPLRRARHLARRARAGEGTV
jgi:deoxyribonuclease V